MLRKWTSSIEELKGNVVVAANANIKYLATEKEKIEIFTGKGKHLCTLYIASSVSIIAVRELLHLRYILYSFFLTLLYLTLEERKQNWL